jgi:hypothetical protein
MPLKIIARSHKIISVSCSRVKVTRRGDNQEGQGGMTTRSDKTHLSGFPKKNKGQLLEVSSQIRADKGRDKCGWLYLDRLWDRAAYPVKPQQLRCGRAC